MFKSLFLITLCTGALCAADDLGPRWSELKARAKSEAQPGGVPDGTPRSVSVQVGASPVASGAANFVTGQAARAVIGQKTFTDNLSGTSDTRFGGIGGLALAGNTLFATDANRIGLLPMANRVLVFRDIDQQLPAADASIPVNAGLCPVCGGRANVVMGQAKFADADFATARNRMRLPTAVASDGLRVAVADTSNNRVLLWNSIPTANDSGADVVLGQDTFTTNKPGVGAGKMRGPQGVWIQDGRLFVADTGNNRVLIWNTIPTQNGQAANVVLGQPNFDAAPAPVNLTDLGLPGSATTMLTPVAVSSDGVRLIVSDLGYNRILIFKSIPTQNQAPADVVVGQIDFTKTFSNQSEDLCASTGTNSAGEKIYPGRCAATMNFPRYAISDGQRLFVADGGNDRVLIFNQIPTVNGTRADVILGQPDEFSSIVTSDNTLFVSAANVTPTPTSLAWNGRDLYVADPTDYRILVFSPGNQAVGATDIVNSASRAIFASGSFTIGGTIRDVDTVTLTIAGKEYPYKIVTGDTAGQVAAALVNLINAANNGAGDSNVRTFVENDGVTIRVIAKTPGNAGNQVTLASTLSPGAPITAAASGLTLIGGGDASVVAPGTLVIIKAAPGASLAETVVRAPDDVNDLPRELGGVEVYVNGFRTPLLMVSPTEISTQIPYEMKDATTTAVGTYSLGGTSKTGVIITLIVGGRSYQYTLTASDTLEKTAIALVDLINTANGGQGDSNVRAVVAQDGLTIILFARKPGNARTTLFSTVAPPDTISVLSNGATLAGGGDGSLSVVVRFTRADGSVSVTNAIGLELRPAAPGIIACDRARLPACEPGGEEPRSLLSLHTSDYATGIFSVDGSPVAGDVAIAKIGDMPVSVTVAEGDTLVTIRGKLVDAINAHSEVAVTASPANQFTRIRLRAKVPGPEGNGTTLSGSVTPVGNSSLAINSTNAAMCCASAAGRLVTPENPAVPGEVIIFYATGLGLVVPDQDDSLLVTGRKFAGSTANTPSVNVFAQVAGASGQVVSAGAKPGTIGLYEVVMEVPAGAGENSRARINISQDVYTSNTVTLPIGPPPQR